MRNAPATSPNIAIHTALTTGFGNGATRRRLTELAHASIRAESFRFDASDLMPTPVGLRSFWRGMVEWFEQGPDELDRIMADIEATWPDASSLADDDDGIATDVDAIDSEVFDVPQLDRPVSLSIPEGWVLHAATDGLATFVSIDSAEQIVVGLLRPAYLIDPTVPQPASTSEPWPRWPRSDIEGWLANFDDRVIAAGPERREIGGVEALYFEVEITDLTACEAALYCIGLAGRTSDEQGWDGWVFESNERYRIWWIDSGFGPPLIVSSITPIGDRNADAEADVLLDSLVIG